MTGDLGSGPAAASPADPAAEEHAAIDRAIEALEAQRVLLGDEVVETALRPVLERRDQARRRLAGEQRKLVTVLFADLVDFTRFAAQHMPADVLQVLNMVFSVFDQLTDEFGVEKVKTIGDAYMVVGGMPHRSDDHAERVTAMALDLAESVGRIDAAARHGISFRIGINCGPVVAGVIGTRKFIYDVWGDTVNMASRMESLGVPGRVQVTHAVATRLAGSFELETRGLIDVKGKGPTPTYFVLRRKQTSADAAGSARREK